jgi:hypothetical protein
MKTLSQILVDVNSYIDLAAELPIGEDLDVRINYARQAVEEWSSAYRWRQLKGVASYLATTASIPLPSNFRELTGVPRVNTTEYPEIQPEERHQYGTGDRYCYILGGLSNYHLIVNGISDSETISIDYQRYPSNFATLSSICEVPDPTFVRLKVQALILQSRLDARFQTVDAEAQRILQNMIGREMNLRPGGSQSIPRKGSTSWRLGSHYGR